MAARACRPIFLRACRRFAFSSQTRPPDLAAFLALRPSACSSLDGSQPGPNPRGPEQWDSAHASRLTQDSPTRSGGSRLPGVGLHNQGVGLHCRLPSPARTRRPGQKLSFVAWRGSWFRLARYHSPASWSKSARQALKSRSLWFNEGARVLRLRSSPLAFEAYYPRSRGSGKCQAERLCAESLSLEISLCSRATFHGEQFQQCSAF